MKRRDFLKTAAASVLAVPLVARAVDQDLDRLIQFESWSSTEYDSFSESIRTYQGQWYFIDYADFLKYPQLLELGTEKVLRHFQYPETLLSAASDIVVSNARTSIGSHKLRQVHGVGQKGQQYSKIRWGWGTNSSGTRTSEIIIVHAVCPWLTANKTIIMGDTSFLGVIPTDPLKSSRLVRI